MLPMLLISSQEEVIIQEESMQILPGDISALAHDHDQRSSPSMPGSLAPNPSEHISRIHQRPLRLPHIQLDNLALFEQQPFRNIPELDLGFC